MTTLDNKEQCDSPGLEALQREVDTWNVQELSERMQDVNPTQWMYHRARDLYRIIYHGVKDKCAQAQLLEDAEQIMVECSALMMEE